MTLHETRKWQIFSPVILSFSPAVDSHLISVNLSRVADTKVYQEQLKYLDNTVVRCTKPCIFIIEHSKTLLSTLLHTLHSRQTCPMQQRTVILRLHLHTQVHGMLLESRTAT